MKIIVNADDLGLTHESNLGVADAFGRGYCTQTTCVVNSEFTEEGAATAHERGFADRVGLHFNLSECRPLSEAIESLPKYVADGTLHYTPRYMDKATYGCSPFLTYVGEYLEDGFGREVEAVRDEVRAQVERFRELGFACSHIDSHTNMLVDLPVWLAARPVVEQAGFRTMRCTFDSFATDDLYNRMYRTWLAAERADAHLTCVGYSSSVPRFMKRREALDAASTVEIYIHPILVDGQLVDNFTGGNLLDDEMRELEGLERTTFFEL